MTEKPTPQAGAMMWVPKGAYIVYPTARVVELLGHSHPGSTRKLMTTVHGFHAVRGWPVEEVVWVLENGRDMDLVERRRAGKRPTTEEGQ